MHTHTHIQTHTRTHACISDRQNSHRWTLYFMQPLTFIIIWKYPITPHMLLHLEYNQVFILSLLFFFKQMTS
uniref:Uncharacterized protein n=1 Tax=Anguilla anguilla TaxID=7936 RepID=A0A0E9PMV9_ANGAN